MKYLLKKRWIPTAAVLIALATLAPFTRLWFLGLGDWVYETTDSMENNFYRDTGFIKRQGDTITYRQKVEYGPELIYQLTKLTGELIPFDVQDVTLNCKTGTIRQGRMTPQAYTPRHRLGDSYLFLCKGQQPHTAANPGTPASQKRNPQQTQQPALK